MVKCLYARTHSIFMPSTVIGWWSVACVLVLSFSVVSLRRLPLFHTLLVLWPELLPCGQRQGNHSLRLRQLRRCLVLWQNSLLPQVMSQSFLTTSTIRRLLNWSSRKNPTTKKRSPRTCVTQNSTSSSEKRYLHHCSLRSEKNQRTEDKLVTLRKKVCCQLSLFSHTQERRDPCTNLVRARS